MFATTVIIVGLLMFAVRIAATEGRLMVRIVIVGSRREPI
jgi:hypothetical protein